MFKNSSKGTHKTSASAYCDYSDLPSQLVLFLLNFGSTAPDIKTLTSIMAQKNLTCRMKVKHHLNTTWKTINRSIHSIKKRT